MQNDSSTSPPEIRALPVKEGERIVAIDVLRGFALLGILIMNIRLMAGIDASYHFPNAYGTASTGDTIAWWVGEILAHRKFMTIFSLLFGAGLVLQSERALAAGRSLKGLWLRRMFWLWVIGLAHAYLVWHGDILVSYAVAGVAIYPLRKVRPGILLALALVLLLVASSLTLFAGLTYEGWPTNNQEGFLEGFRPTPEAIAAEIAAFRGSWFDEIRFRAPHTLEMHLMVLPFYFFWRAAGMMLLGMALFRKGLLGDARPAVYGRWIAAGLLVGLPLTVWGVWRQTASEWEPASAFFIDSQFGFWGSLPLALAWAGAVLLAVQRNWWPALQSRLAAIGRTALSNYLLQSLLATTVFFGRGLGLFAKVSPWAQFGVVVAIWALQLWLAPWWLRRFRLGPMEWVWRRLSYRTGLSLRRAG